MKITFVQPPGLMAVDNYSTITQPPLGIAYLAAYARQHGHEVHVVDAVGAAVTRIHPWPKRARRLVQLLKPGGKIAITLYPAYNRAYVLATQSCRTFTTRLPRRILYALAHAAIPLYYLYRIPGLYHLGCATFPICMHQSWRWRVLDT